MTYKPTECITQAFHSSCIHVSPKLELTQVNRQVIKQTQILHSGGSISSKKGADIMTHVSLKKCFASEIKSRHECTHGTQENFCSQPSGFSSEPGMHAQPLPPPNHTFTEPKLLPLPKPALHTDLILRPSKHCLLLSLAETILC